MVKDTIQKAKQEVEAVLKRYRVRWDQIAPDRDDEIWKEIRPTAKRIRRELFRKSYPSLQ